MAQLQRPRRRFLVEMFDVLFIMILCFATLFLSMFMAGHALGEINYMFNGARFALVLAVAVLYLAFVLYHSERDLVSMVRKLYAGHHSAPPGRAPP
jgi:uncharacterized membrane-anchored protein